MLSEWGPVLALPVRHHPTIRPDIDEDDVRCAAFATVDFERTMPQFDTLRYKEDRLREELRDVIILVDTSKRRLPQKAMYLVLKYLRMGIIDIDDIESVDMLILAWLYLRARRIEREIGQLEESHSRRNRAALRDVLG